MCFNEDWRVYPPTNVMINFERKVYLSFDVFFCYMKKQVTLKKLNKPQLHNKNVNYNSFILEIELINVRYKNQ